MRSEALYQKYRSQNFDEVVGQEYVVRSVRNAIREEKVGHAYLFCGPRGTGKTSMARLLARAVNCENSESAPCGECENCRAAVNGNHPDIIEINAANETHVEDIRDLIDRARLSPMMGKHKIYIIDEVHQLSSSAASALLKTLEEPPEHIIFILATTDPQKLLSTIISRCQRFDFSKVSTPQIRDHLLNIAQAEGMNLEKKAAEKIAQLADGGMRDALSMLEQAASYANRDIHEADIDSIYGLASIEEKLELIKAIVAGDFATLLHRIEGYESSGLDIKRLTTDLIDALKDSVIYSYTKNDSLLRSINSEQAQLISGKIGAPAMLNMIEVLMKASEDYKMAQSVSSVFEVACMKMVVKNAAEPLVKVEVPVETVSSSLPITQVNPEPKHVDTLITPINGAVPTTLDITESPGEVKETKVIEEETLVSKPVVEVIETVEMSQTEQIDLDMVVQILVQCTKDEKAIDTEKLLKLTDGYQMDRFIAILKQTELKASGADCMLLTTGSQAVADNVNSFEMNRSFYQYLKESASIDKVVFMITDKLYNDAVKKFVELRKMGSLPEPLAIDKYTKKEKKKGDAPKDNSPEAKLRMLLDDDEILKVYD